MQLVFIGTSASYLSICLPDTISVTGGSMGKFFHNICEERERFLIQSRSNTNRGNEDGAKYIS